MDAFWKKTAAIWKEAVGLKIAIASTQVAFATQLAATYTAVKVDQIGLKVDGTRVVIKRPELEISDRKQKIAMGAAYLLSCGIVSIG